MGLLRWREFKSHLSNVPIFHMRKLRSKKVKLLDDNIAPRSRVCSLYTSVLPS